MRKLLSSTAVGKGTTVGPSGAAWSKAYVCGQSGENVGSNPTRPWLSVCCECCVSGSICDAPTTRPEESYRLWCVWVCDLETSWMRRPCPTGGCRAKSKQREGTTTDAGIGLGEAWSEEIGKAVRTQYCSPVASPPDPLTAPRWSGHVASMKEIKDK
jgi:hypothetical protein